MPSYTTFNCMSTLVVVVVAAWYASIVLIVEQLDAWLNCRLNRRLFRGKRLRRVILGAEWSGIACNGGIEGCEMIGPATIFFATWSTASTISLNLRIRNTISHQIFVFPKMKLLRRLMPLNARGRPSRAWAVCVDCLRYRPTKKSYWRAKQSVRVKTKTWGGVVKSWNMKYSLQCPECWRN